MGKGKRLRAIRSAALQIVEMRGFDVPAKSMARQLRGDFAAFRHTAAASTVTGPRVPGWYGAMPVSPRRYRKILRLRVEHAERVNQFIAEGEKRQREAKAKAKWHRKLWRAVSGIGKKSAGPEPDEKPTFAMRMSHGTPPAGEIQRSRKANKQARLWRRKNRSRA